MAAPSVSGLLLYSVLLPKLSPKAVRKVLMESVVKIDYELELGYDRVKPLWVPFQKQEGLSMHTMHYSMLVITTRLCVNYK